MAGKDQIVVRNFDSLSSDVQEAVTLAQELLTIMRDRNVTVITALQSISILLKLHFVNDTELQTALDTLFDLSQHIHPENRATFN